MNDLTEQELKILHILQRHKSITALEIIKHSNNTLEISNIYMWIARLYDKYLIRRNTIRRDPFPHPPVRVYSITEQGLSYLVETPKYSKAKT